MVFKRCAGHIKDNTERFITGVCTFMACAFGRFTRVTHTHRHAGLVPVSSTERPRGASEGQKAVGSSSLLERARASEPGTLLRAAPGLSCSPAGVCPQALRSSAWPRADGWQRPAPSSSPQPEEDRAKGPRGGPGAENPSLVTEENEGKEKALCGSFCFPVSSLC